jgi:glycosyltransferase involved in cell wall biosynthesis
MTKRLAIFLRAVGAAHQLKGEGVDLLHSHFAWLSGAAAWVCSRLLGIPFTVTTHAYDHYFSNDLLSLVVNQADHVVTISEYNRQHLKTEVGRPSGDISVIHCGVNVQLLRRKQIEEDERVPNQPIRILSVGSLQAKKGHTYLIDACHHLERRGIEFRCSIVGAGPAESALRRKIGEANLQTRVHLLGARPHPDILDSYHQHDIFVLASVVASGGDMDGIPVVLMEAGAASLPLVSTRVSGIPELVRHGQTGLLVEPGNATALADAIATLAADPVLRDSLGQRARLLVCSEFDIETNAGHLASLFLSVAEAAAQSSENNTQKA